MKRRDDGRGTETPRTETLCPLLGIPTGLASRAWLAEPLVDAAARGEPASLALVDVDEFAALNRLLGAERADDVLRAVTRRVEAAAPAGSRLARLAGDVFALAMPGLDLEQALIALGAVCAAVSAKPVAAGRGPARRQAYPTVSAGVAALAPRAGVGETAERLLDETLGRAQAALRRAKELGAGRVAAPPEDRMVLKTSYYSQTQLGRLRALAQRLAVPESALLRQALEELLLRFKASPERPSAEPAGRPSAGAPRASRSRHASPGESR